MLRKVCIILLNSGSVDLRDCAMPIMHAMTARALDCEVEMYFVGPAIRLLTMGDSADLAAPGATHTLREQLRMARQEGIELFACSAAQRTYIKGDMALADYCSGVAGATSYLARALDPDWRVLTY
ncbi:MAG: DsrE family protein [Gallionellaceae bacterium]|nr:DsrE family protein [Gallionellaceae bacterium]